MPIVGHSSVILFVVNFVLRLSSTAFSSRGPHMRAA